MDAFSLDSYADKENPTLKKTARNPDNRLRSFGHDITNITLRPLDIDSQDSYDPQRLGYYAFGIFEYLQTTEKLYLAKEGYMKRQTEINEGMRGILIDWIIEVHLKFKLLPETLYLAVNLIDRFLDIRSANTSELQLIGVSSLLIACKYEEIYFPDIKDMAKITDDTYTKKEIVEMEAKILSSLEYNITTPSSYRFLERYSRLAELSQDDFFIAQYLIEIALLDYKLLKYSPSLTAASSVYLTNKLTNKSKIWPDYLIRQTKYHKCDLRNCAKDLYINLRATKTSTYQALFKKFSLSKFNEVAKNNLILYL